MEQFVAGLTGDRCTSHYLILINI